MLTGAIALFTSRWWRELGSQAVAVTRPVDAAEPLPRPIGWGEGQGEGRGPLLTFGFGRVYLSVTLLVLVQLILGATMRHQHAGLAVPDFPQAYGKLWPATDADSVARYNRARLETKAFNDITANQILVHMVHRLTAVAIFLAIGGTWWLTRRKLPPGHLARRLAGLWLALVVVQFGLGAWTVWSNKAADITTLHVVTGALTLLTGALLTLVSFRCGSLNPIAPAGPLMAGGCSSASIGYVISRVKTTHFSRVQNHPPLRRWFQNILLFPIKNFRFAAGKQPAEPRPVELGSSRPLPPARGCI